MFFQQYLSKGQAVPDDILIEIITGSIRKLPQGTGWVLEGFPTTVRQAVIFEKALTGKDVSEGAANKKAAKYITVLMNIFLCVETKCGTTCV